MIEERRVAQIFRGFLASDRNGEAGILEITGTFIMCSCYGEL